MEKRFEFQYVHTINKKAVSLHVKAVAYLRPDKSVMWAEPDRIFWNGERLPDNFFFHFDVNLWETLNQCATFKANKIYYPINTQPESFTL